VTVRHVSTGSSMATMYVERCRRRAGGDSSDVIEPWFMMSRSAYQRILDVALADMTSAEVLERACSASSRGSELLRLLSTGGNDVTDDVTEQLPQQSRNDDVADNSPDDELTSTHSVNVRTRSPHVTLLECDAVTGDMDTLPLSLVAKQTPGASERRRRLDWSTDKEGKRLWTSRDAMTSSQPLCLRVPSYPRSRHVDTAQSSRRRRSVAAACRHLMSTAVSAGSVDELVDEENHSRTSSLKTHIDDDHGRVSDVRTASEERERSKDQHQNEIPELSDRSRRQKPSNDLTRKRKSLRQPEAEVVRVGVIDGDGWAPIDKDVLVSIVERLSVSCLQPSTTASSLSPSNVLSKTVVNTPTSTSPTEFRQPLTSVTTPPRRCESSGRTGGRGVDVTKPATVPPASSRPGQAELTPPRKTQRLRTTSPALVVRGTGRRKSTFQRRVNVRETWSVPADKSLCRLNRKPSTSTETAERRRVGGAGNRHVWAPLEKSVVLSVIDHILVDSDVDDGRATDSSDTKERCEQTQTQTQSRRRWLQPPSLRAITTTSPHTPTNTTSNSSDHPTTTAAEASFKWKSNILLRMRQEQTVVATSSGRWLDLVPEAVAATGS